MARPLPFLLYSGLNGRSERRHTERLDRLLSEGTLTRQARDARLALDLPPRPRGEVLWFHAATQFALRPAVELFARIAEDRPDLCAVITMSPGVHPPNNQRPEGVIFSEAPEDETTIVRRFLSHWRPDGLIWIGGRFRPTLLRAAHDEGLPTLSIEAPHSPSTLDLPAPIPGLRNAVLKCFDHAITASAESSVPWRRADLDPKHVECLGYLEEGGIAPIIDDEELSRRSGELGTRPCWFAAQVELPELNNVLRAHKSALRRAHRLLLVMSLSDASTLASVLHQCEDTGLNAMALGPEDSISEALQIAVLTGESTNQDGLWHRLSPVSFLGRSLVPFGGIDPYPAAAMGSAILHGPHVNAHATAYARLATGNATRQVRDGHELGEELGQLMSPDQIALMAAAAWEIASTGAEVTDRVSALVQDILDLRERRST
ncbi:3-deoxy-D-manno-octulosonic acid transferase [Celeribacter persicus]|uniref:3-deoxy-D-manno-octulosonic acid transferase n=1 Tax=Celeribacter persicus TaxID=1651082 RepID=A0A2T5HF23_9RHOB|nr:glycosyltransferase N-terminal domain-containing protein [Celeribacter persicus]PTQ70171.1 3-deoxy-D-manno-octulosonic-acid transferase [Celeribacter persicus]